ncbi:MAG: SIS domain-containing protein [Gammaproteobacteria bacterium]|jgi:DnaA initiator-associating protein|nr:SIS domain-containing protein [Gammaproteobacteria bacterium]MBV04333.1 phosphoheptose isomerase [Paracoccaceae bacterium]MBT5406626.1 SIS domain-containing protein [Gammaproteobacteria bacterium]MBT5644654.1 SIS domain-containing protein [Gammaproteobacteria bacterium]MBT5862816.1 SIS domain-containing protein [Gammaproteobacteria bacterium]|tara:strand:- start:646 stop:1233 length:588 start_codon:yes stop_codon:yes gene_type:complete
MKNIEIIKSNFIENQKINLLSVDKISPSIDSAVNCLIKMINGSGKLMSCGNGGSSGDAQHIASEFVNRFEIERKEMPAISLNSDTTTITSIGNDYGYEYIFSKQINAIGNEKDILMAFTTSGNSKNIIEAIYAAKRKNIKVLLVTGGTGGKAKDLIGPDDISIIVPSNRTSRIQEMTLIVIHSICECIDKYCQNR